MWIESHQTLRDHPKLRKFAHALHVPRTCAIGMLHMLWWWALEHAQTGDLSDYSAVDIAIAMEWDGDPDALLDALVDCGPGTRSGFVDRSEKGLVLHDWEDYAGKLIARRIANRNRMKEARATHVQSTHRARAERPNLTVPNHLSSSEPARADVESLCTVLADCVGANTKKRPAVTARWRDEARRLLDIDKVPLAEAEKVARWCTADSFWRANILGMPKFREKYPQLRLRMESERNPQPLKVVEY